MCNEIQQIQAFIDDKRTLVKYEPDASRDEMPQVLDVLEAALKICDAYLAIPSANEHAKGFHLALECIVEAMLGALDNE